MNLHKNDTFQNLRVLFLYPRLSVPNSNELFSGGAQKISYQIALYLKKLNANVYFASDDRQSSHIVKEFKKNKITHITIPFGSKSPFSIIKSFIKLLITTKKNKINLIHSHHRWTTIYSFFASRVFKIPMVYNSHNVFYDKRIFHNFAGNNIIAVSESVKDNLVNYFGIDSNKIKVIYNGTDITPSTDNIKNEIKKELSINENDRIVSVIARFSKQKGHKYLIEALPLVIKKFPSLKVMFVGNGELRDSLKRQIENLCIENNIIFCGSRNDVAPFIEISEFTILPSLWEGLPGSIIESLSLGKPVVATTVGGTPEVIANKVNGILIEPKEVNSLSNAIIYMLSHPDETKEMGKRGKEIASHYFSLHQMLEKYKQYYIQLLNSD